MPEKGSKYNFTAKPEPLPSPPGDPSSFGLPTKIRREIEHPFDVVGQTIKKTVESPLGPEAIDTYLTALGAGRVLRGGGISGAGIPGWRPSKSLTGMDKLGPAAAGVKPYRLSPPPTGKQYLEAFRKNVAGGEEMGAVGGAVNVIRNAEKAGVKIPFAPNDMFDLKQSPYIAREMFKYMDKQMGGRLFGPPPGY